MAQDRDTVYPLFCSGFPMGIHANGIAIIFGIKRLNNDRVRPAYSDGDTAMDVQIILGTHY